MKYKIIKTKSQYKTYCKMLEELVYKAPKSKLIKEEIALLTLLIEKWDEEHSPFTDKNPIALILSDILSYKKGLSKANIRILASHFKISQEALNKPYKLKLVEEYA